MTERDFQKQVIQVARMRGWRVCHFHDSRRMVRGRLVGDADAAGFPDLTLCHPRHGLAFVELKAEDGRLRVAQREWLNALHDARQVAYVWRPSMWRSIDRFLSTGQMEAAA